MKSTVTFDIAYALWRSWSSCYLTNWAVDGKKYVTRSRIISRSTRCCGSHSWLEFTCVLESGCLYYCIFVFVTVFAILNLTKIIFGLNLIILACIQSRTVFLLRLLAFDSCTNTVFYAGSQCYQNAGWTAMSIVNLLARDVSKVLPCC